MDRATAISSLRRFLQPGETMVSLRRGRLIRISGPEHISVHMQFGDGVARNVWLRPGERVATLIIRAADGSHRTQHFRSACSNGFGDGRFVLPNGWSINYDETALEGGIPAITPPAEIPAPAPAPVPALVVNYEAIAQMVASGKEHASVVIEVKPDYFKVEVKNFDPAKKNPAKK